MIYDNFLPGRWLDSIDVNDFVSLNKKPFSERPFFLIKTEKTEKENDFIKKVREIIENREIEKKQNWNFFEVAPSKIKKISKAKIIDQLEKIENYNHMQLDIRRIALYGTDKVINEDKRWYFKKLDEQFPTIYWTQKKKKLLKQIEQLKNFERFCYANFQIDVSKPADSAKQCVEVIVLTLLYACLESPQTSHSLCQSIQFLDIYFEELLINGEIKEEEIMEILKEYQESLTILSKRFELQETLDTRFICKTMYRFFSVLDEGTQIKWNVIVTKETENGLYHFLECIKEKKEIINFYNEDFFRNTEGVSVFEKSNFGIIGEQLPVEAGICDLEKIFYLSLNGGKDIEKNINLTIVTQPHLKDKITYEEALSKFNDFLVYVISNYIKAINIYLQLDDIENKKYFHQSLISNTYQTVSLLHFYNIEKVAEILNAIQLDAYVIQRKNHWIKKIEIKEEIEKGSCEGIALQIFQIIKGEVKKIPIYQKGNYRIKISQKTPNEKIEIEDVEKTWVYIGEFNQYEDGLVSWVVPQIELSREHLMNFFSNKIFEIRQEKKQKNSPHSQ